MWLSVPVILGGLVSMLAIIALLVHSPGATLLGLVPLVFVAPVLFWLDRVEPEPRSACVHSFLWGALVATLISAVVNSVVNVAAGTGVATVVSAPLVEELTKAGALWYAVRRRELDGVMDGIIYAGWSALGFAVVEDMLYFNAASDENVLAPVFVVRAILVPFAHPLFTAWTGLGLGYAVARGLPRLRWTAFGYLLAVVTHVVWNGALLVGASNQALLPVAALAFVILFLAGGGALVETRRREQQQFIQSVPWLAVRYGLSPDEIAVFGSWRRMWATRRGLNRADKKLFDRFHAALARLAYLHEQPGPTDPATESVLASELQQARWAGLA